MRLDADKAEALLKREIRAADQQRGAVLNLGRKPTAEEREIFTACTKRIGELTEELARLWSHGDWSGLEQRLRNGEAKLEVKPRKTFVVEVAGEGVLAFRADYEYEAEDLVHDYSESELIGGIQAELLNRNRADGRPLWDGRSKLGVRLATDAEHEIWLQNRNAAIGHVIDIGDDLDDFNVFLVDLKLDHEEQGNGKQ
jgi:hypothetical protein